MGNKEHEEAIPNIVGSMSLLRKVENYYGMIRYRVVDGELYEPSVAMKSYIIFIPAMIVIGWTCILLDTWLNIKLGTFFNTNLDTSEFIDKLPMIVTVVQTILSVEEFLRYNKDNIKIINSLAHIDCLLKLHNNKEFYDKLGKRNRIAMYFFFLALTSSIVQNYLENHSAIIYNVIEALIDFKFHLQTLSFYIYIKMISKRMDVLNKYIKKFVDKKDESRSVIISKENMILQPDDYIGCISQRNTKITSLAFAYETLGESLMSINNMCSTDIFMYLASNFIYIIVSLWSFVNFIRTRRHLSSLPGIIYETSVEISVVIIMCYVCEALTMKRDSTRMLVNEIIMDYKLPHEMRIQAKSFIHLTDVWTLRVCASSMFCMNIQLFLKFIGLSSTYLIFIIQATN